MAQAPFREWLAHKSWALAVRYCKAVACLLPPAAFAADAAVFRNLGAGPVPGFDALVAWQIVAEIVCLSVWLADRWMPVRWGREGPLYFFCAVFMAMCTWVGLADGALHGDLALHAAGSTFIAAVICTPLPVRRPMYVLSFLVLAAAAWARAADPVAFLAALVNPFCVTVLCIELDRFTHRRNLELYNETQRAEAERLRADKVLYNVLPTPVAEELKQKESVNAVKYENMGVLFADIVGFTRFARYLPPDALVVMLNDIFSRFDALVDRHCLEKIKTIGDAYMVVSHESSDELCRLALDMFTALEAYNRANGTQLRLRVGLHAGPAVAGVIGVKRFLYDVWGDTVNVASRLEASGEPGLIHASEAIYRQAREGFQFAPREPVDIKGWGAMSTYWLLGPTPA